MSEIQPDGTSFQHLPAYDIAGMRGDSEDQVRAEIAEIRENQIIRKFPHELPFPEGREEELKNVARALGFFLADLGVQVAPQKMPSPQRFHFFADEKAMHRALCAALGRQDNPERYTNANAICDYSNNYVLEDGQQLSHANHAAIHFMGYELWQLQPVRQRNWLGRKRTVHLPHQVQAGYQLRSAQKRPIRFEFLHAALAEMTSIYVQQGYWPDYPNLPVKPTTEPSHIVSLITVEEMIKKTAADQEVDPKVLFLSLAKGLFTGNTKAMDTVSHSIGPAFRIAVEAPSVTDSFEAGFALAAQIGLPQVKERFDEAEAAQALEAFEWM